MSFACCLPTKSGVTVRERIHSPPQAWEPRSRWTGIPAAEAADHPKVEALAVEVPAVVVAAGAGLHSNTRVVGVEHKPLEEQGNKQAPLPRKH